MLSDEAILSLLRSMLSQRALSSLLQQISSQAYLMDNFFEQGALMKTTDAREVFSSWVSVHEASGSKRRLSRSISNADHSTNSDSEEGASETNSNVQLLEDSASEQVNNDTEALTKNVVESSHSEVTGPTIPLLRMIDSRRGHSRTESGASAVSNASITSGMSLASDSSSQT